MAKCLRPKNAILVARVFLDTNTLIYSNDDRVQEKKIRCAKWLRELSSSNQAVVNLQVLNEFTNVMIRKKIDNNIERVFLLVQDFSLMGTTPLKYSTIANAKNILLNTNYGWWDCLLLAAAKELNCTYFLSEDMADRHNVDGVTIINPFLHLPSEIS